MMQKKGMTLVEVLVSLALTAVIAAPFLTLFIQSTRGRLISKRILYANHAAVNHMEKLVGMNCREVCLSSGDFIENDFLIKIKSIPWTPQGNPCFYLIFQNGGQTGKDCMIIPPDGKGGIFLDVLPELMNIQIMINKGKYKIYADSHSVTGRVEDGQKPIIIVNGAYKPENSEISLNIEGDAEVVVYSGKEEINIEWEGTPVVNKNIYYRDYTLFRSAVEVYDAKEADKMLSRVESILRIPN